MTEKDDSMMYCTWQIMQKTSLKARIIFGLADRANFLNIFWKNESDLFVREEEFGVEKK